MLSAESLRGELLELWAGGNIPTKAILMATHNIEEAVFMAERQMGTMINWGRYAELLAYDDDDEMFYLEVNAVAPAA